MYVIYDSIGGVLNVQQQRQDRVLIGESVVVVPTVYTGSRFSIFSSSSSRVFRLILDSTVYTRTRGFADIVLLKCWVFFLLLLLLVLILYILLTYVLGFARIVR